jgi:hypothetical protein
MADTKLTGLTADTTPGTDSLLYTVDDPSGTPASRKSTIGQVLVVGNMPTGSVVQMVSVNSGAVATGTTIMPYDDTIPQITEGDEYMTRAITPTSATNRLVIEITAMLSNSVNVNHTSMALFQDATANALAATAFFGQTATEVNSLVLKHEMAAGTTSSTTFRMRAGIQTAGTVTFNGAGAGRKFGGITVSNITIFEIKA